jgi:hypothetical protein
MLGEDIVIAIAGALCAALRVRCSVSPLPPSPLQPPCLSPSHTTHTTHAPPGNKCDMEKGRNVDREEALRYTASINGVHHLTSAKSGAGIGEAFTELMKRIVAKKKRGAAGGGGGSGSAPQGRQTIMVVDEEPARKTKQGGCC